MAKKPSAKAETRSNVVTPDQFSSMRTMSVLLSRASLAARSGQTFGGKRDLYNVFGYRKTLTFADHLAKYARQDIAARIVDAPADALWQEPPEVTGPGDFETAWKKVVRGAKLWNRFNRLDKLVGLGRFGIMLIGFDDATDIATPIRSGEQREVIYLQPYSESSVSIMEFEQDIRSPRYGKPKRYKIDVADPAFSSGSVSMGVTATKTRSLEVHHTRVLHVAENTLEDEVFGIPRLQRVFNLLDDLIKVAGGAAETYWLSGRQGMQLDIDPDMELDAADATALSDEIEDYQHELRRVIRTRGVTIKNLGSDVADPSGPFKVIIALIAATTGIPQRILLGAEAGQLASEQDRANWAERVTERQTSFGNDVMLLPFVELLQAANALPGGDVINAADIETEWPEAFKLSPLERDQSRAQFARSIANISRSSQTGEIATLGEVRVRLGLPEEKPSEDEMVGDQMSDTQLAIKGVNPDGSSTDDDDDDENDDDPKETKREIDERRKDEGNRD